MIFGPKDTRLRLQRDVAGLWKDFDMISDAEDVITIAKLKPNANHCQQMRRLLC